MSTGTRTEPAVPLDEEPQYGNQHLAIGLYIGSLILIIGLMLAGYGAFGGAQLNQDGSTINKDLAWGLVMIAVGLMTLALAWFSPRHRATRPHHREPLEHTGQADPYASRRATR
jgi:hypothetical protein